MIVDRLKLKTIISLLPAEPSADLKEFCAQQNITYVTTCTLFLYGLLTLAIRHLWYQVGKMKDEVTVSPAQVATILEV